MRVDENTNVAGLLDEHPDLLDTFVKVSPHFKKLENKFLRRTIARRVKIADAARVGGVDLAQLINSLNSQLEGSASESQAAKHADSETEWEDKYSQEFEYRDDEIQQTLDVREDIATNRDPLSKIMRTAKDIGVGKILVVVNSFEPIPLYEVLGRKGFIHRTETDGDVFRVLFKREAVDRTLSRSETLTGSAAEGEEKIIEMDVRGLEPPEPMMKILKAINTIGENTILLVHHHREPIFLYDKLKEKEFEAITNKVEENHYKIVIRRRKTG